MGKAFSEDERKLIEARLKEVGLDLLAKKGIKKVSIGEITKEVGIAKGGFYRFYQSKEDFVMALFKGRIVEKLQDMEKLFPYTLKEPVKFLSQVFYEQGMHLKDNKAFNDGVSDSWLVFLSRDRKEKVEIMKYYRDFLLKLISFWEENGYKVIYDMNGLLNSISMAAVIISNVDKVSDEYFCLIYRQYCDTVVPQFLKADMN